MKLFAAIKRQGFYAPEEGRELVDAFKRMPLRENKQSGAEPSAPDSATGAVR
ncbi:hypothetical protein JFU37_25410 [Pseudomonas sp. TH41]|uniref:hypothetical protein n=1 Tax=Pseudomonas sp. TH41 TaxID=2796405 RepID=UPI001914C14E|nr:hypothetical protein [Pseudomonas sp. TH41]MBK5355824.1 hypothetical protein [Pseudomonas sp. TH41]